MECSTDQRDGALVFRASGAIDHGSAEAFEQALIPLLGSLAPGSRLVLDLSGVDYMSSVGLRVLMLVSKQARRQQGKVVVASLQPTLAEIFSISRFDRVFDVHADLREALSTLSGDALAAYDGGA